MDAVVVETALGVDMRHTTQSSYQAWTYGFLIESFNEEVQSRPIQLHPCAYIHNYCLQDNDTLIDPHFQEHIEKYLFLQKAIEKLKFRHFYHISEGELTFSVWRQSQFSLFQIKSSSQWTIAVSSSSPYFC